jgi:hypothetical protein
MPVPDETIFGDNPRIGGITYREVRKIKNNQQKLEILKSRIDSFLTMHYKKKNFIVLMNSVRF